MQIKKADGSVEPFDPQKLKDALRRAGAEVHVADEIATHVMTVCQESHGSEAVKTEFIYHLAFRQLKNISRSAALKFSLKRALLEIGPSGFPFEEFIAAVWRRQGYTAITGQIVYGTCVSHEVDVIAWKPDELVMIEAKYHSDSGSRTDLKTALYVKARYDDIRQQEFTLKSFDLSTVGDKSLTDMHLFEKGSQHIHTEMPQKLTEGWLITNTHFSDTAITYGSCNDLKMMSFDYPEVGSLQELIITHSLYPITCLTTLNSGEKKKLISENIILCATLYEKSESLKEFGFSKEKIFEVLEEVSSLV
ncbi:MAG: hypothetical protein RJB39_341 [Candidatus Parcubacteria bacterium]|jgi:hypothetical protein